MTKRDLPIVVGGLLMLIAAILQVSAGRTTEAIAFALAWFAILGVYLFVRRNRARTTI